MNKGINHILREVFDISQQPQKPLFIFEMANNHMGDVEHGLRIIREFSQVTRSFNFNFAFKFQLRHIASFIHPDYQKRMEIKYVKRFTETELTEKELKRLRNELRKFNFIAISTPFDEASVDRIEELDFDIIKIGSCSFTDWPLLERIVKTEKPIIASVAGVPLEDIDKVMSFLQHRNKRFAIMHCVGEYPTPPEHLQLNQIDLLQERYPGVVIGFSTHESPDNNEAIQLAIGKGARIFEKHVAIKTQKYEMNNYSATPEQVKQWLQLAQRAVEMCGVMQKRSSFSEKEKADIVQFQRGVFAKKLIRKGERIDISDIFFAFPSQKGQLLANDISKYIYYYVKRNIQPNEAVITSDIESKNIREKILFIANAVRDLIKKSDIAIAQKVDLEISHHYGIDKFNQYGLSMMTVVNRDYCKKLIVMLPNQIHPTQYHKKKEETFHILAGEFTVLLDGKRGNYRKGDVITINRGVKHSFSSKNGGVIEEISSAHYKDDSYYEDQRILRNKNRKTYITHWFG